MLVFVRPITAHWSPVGRDFPGHQTGPGGGPVFPRKQDRVLAKEVGHAQGLGWQSAGHVSHPSGLGCPLSSGVQGLPNTKGLWSHSPTAFCISTPATGGGGACAILSRIRGWHCETRRLSDLPSGVWTVPGLLFLCWAPI